MEALGIDQEVMGETLLRVRWRDFPAGPVAKTPHSQCRGLDSIPGWGSRSRIPQPRVRILQLNIPDPVCCN